MRPSALVPVLLSAALLPSPGHAADPAQRFELGGSGARIEGSATVRIHASRNAVFAILGSCAQALKIVPGLETCEVRERAPDGSFERIWEVIEYARLLPRVKVEMRATYAAPVSVTFERIGGDPVSLHGQWRLQSDGEYTIAHYNFTFEPAFWVPHWMLRTVLKRDLPRMLRGLRDTAEGPAGGNLG